MEKRKGHKTSSKGVPISFFQKPKEATKPSNKEINSVSLNHESAELPKSLTKSVFSVATWNDATKNNVVFLLQKKY